MKKLINNELVDLTAEEISQREADIAKDILDEKQEKKLKKT
uniref:Uncharacterized protein n=1 Tax=uncultured organism MedDCM-OCT-S08-C1350 TaxID=743627 RepID=D6PKI2_9ZZZZ|nr:hypothetical protein [uncultured organism MedDCM-OCT-S08-C1350]